MKIRYITFQVNEVVVNARFIENGQKEAVRRFYPNVVYL
jgi:hypothetical protein